MKTYDFLTTSQAIAKIPGIEIFLSGTIGKFASSPTSSTLVGWGRKKSGVIASRIAEENSTDYYCLEDGFIGYWGHPGEYNQRLSLIVDKEGIYYDSNRESALEKILLNQCLEQSNVERVKKLIASIVTHGITKYNRHFDAYTPMEDETYVLVVDQSANDESIQFGQASSKSFAHMLEVALEENPSATIVLKTHPDQVKKKKRGHYSTCKHPRVKLFTRDVCPANLIRNASAVYTVTSQLGFEALLHKKKVICFGMPFYAGWGLTDDRVIRNPRRNKPITLEDLVYASLITYTRYLHPQKHELCEVEDIIAWILKKRAFPSNLTGIGFSFWKRSFIHHFIGIGKSKIAYASGPKTYVKESSSGGESSSIITWGVTNANRLRAQYPQHAVYTMEDGFLRSVGLGSDLKRPNSLVIDKRGIYYDATAPSDLEHILNHIDLSGDQTERARQLIDLICRFGITKYNVGRPLDKKLVSQIEHVKSTQKVILIAGQLHTDASIAYGSPNIKTNRALIERVREDCPNAFLIYKVHPDVVSGNKGDLKELPVANSLCDLVVTSEHIANFYDIVDELCVNTSLAGFEAILRNLPVSAYGIPFYSGWGLTNDREKSTRRSRDLTLEELVYGVLIEYPIYMDWSERRQTSPERIINVLHDYQMSVGSTYLSRLARKLKYYSETLMYK